MAFRGKGKGAMAWKALQGAIVTPEKEEEEEKKEEPKIETLTEEEKVQKEEEDESAKKIKRGMTRLKFLARLNAVSRKKEEEKEEDFTPETRRRFLFDDKALRKGASLHQLFQAEEPPEEDFNEIVDQDDRRVEVFVSQELVGNMIESTHFRIFIFGLIVLNSILIGLQTNEKWSVEYRYLFSIFDQAVLATFVFEILLKWYHGFWIFWKVGWNVLDFVIILALLLGPQLTFLSSSRILRILRVLRAFRSLRSVSALAGLSMVVQTILQSVPDMANICLLLVLILLVFGVSGVTLFGKQVPEKFGDLQTAMFSLFICVTQDGWVEIYELFQAGDPSLRVGGSIYFFLSIMVGAFIFANLVVAVVVANLEMAMKELKDEKEAQVDTLATVTEKTSDEENQPGEQSDKVPLKSFDAIKRHVDLTTQTPLQLADFKGLTTSKLERYFFILMALEDNLAEYLDIKRDLSAMYEVIKSLNDIEYDDDEDDDYLEMLRRGSGINLANLKQGDILSNLIKLEEQKNIDSGGANTMTEVLRTALQQMPNTSGLQAPKKKDGGRLATADVGPRDRRKSSVVARRLSTMHRR